MGIPRSIRARRKLGQSFLIDTDVMRRLAREAGVNGAHTVLEVGPGPGTLTRVLAAKAGHVHAVEVDRQFRSVLDAVRSEHDNVEITWGDARTVDLPSFDVVVASLPYSTALPILFRLLGHGFERGAVLLQERQARRLSALPGAPGYSRVGVMAQRLASIETVARVPRDRFLPEPAVDSALVRVVPLDYAGADGVDDVDDDQLRNLVDALFLRRTSRLDAVLRASGFGAALDNLATNVKRTTVQNLTPQEFGVVADAVAAAGLRVPPVPAKVKRRAN